MVQPATKISTKSCANCTTPFTVTTQDTEHYQKIDVPPPTWCPPCRHLRRHGWINDYVFYTRPCDNCKKPFVSIYPPATEPASTTEPASAAGSPYTVYCNPCWYSEERDNFKQGRPYDFNRPFFEQFNELLKATPQLGIIGMNNENCSFCESVANCKSCYLISECSNCEDCLYGYWLQKSTDCLDCAYIHECERCYQIVDCFNCYNLKYSQNCQGCSDSWFLEGCISSKNCAFSTNLRHKEYYLFNKPYTQEKYFQELEKLGLPTLKNPSVPSPQTLATLQEKFQKFLQTQPRKSLQTENTENCTGDYIKNAKNCRSVFHCYDAEECAYGEHIWRGAKFCMDANTAGRNAELIYESTNCGIDTYNVKFSRYCWGCHDTEYSNSCKNGQYLFGCTSLTGKAKYCILNQQYSPEEWQKTVTKIKEQMRTNKEYGEFFPLKISLFGWNNTPSYDEAYNRVKTKEQTLAKGWKWESFSSSNAPKGQGATSPLIFACTTCARNFKLIPQELEFYSTQNLPSPAQCPDCRHRTRLALRNSKIFRQTVCASCATPTTTTLDPKKYSHILCLPCYHNTVE